MTDDVLGLFAAGLKTAFAAADERIADPIPTDENAVVAEIAKAMEAEGLAASAEPVKLEGVDEWARACGGYDQAPAFAPIPIDDLRARLEACVAAGVTSYRDGPLELKFDKDARKAIKQPAGEITSF